MSARFTLEIKDLGDKKVVSIVPITPFNIEECHAQLLLISLDELLAKMVELSPLQIVELANSSALEHHFDEIQ